ncbi:hypothetical protein FACS1894166_01980 [Bacilli bacterium]|nr:hypothetical protein FACS1894166_01980 [Bacilli bacterium]
MKNKSLAKYNKYSKGKIFAIIFSIMGIAAIGVGVGIGIGYACFHKKISPDYTDPNVVPDSLLDLNGKEVEGFSDAVVKDHSLLTPYTVLDLHGRTLGGNVHFDRATFND